MINGDDIATKQQVRMFFALARELGYDSEEVKERAKKKYNLAHFPEITKQQISDLIDLLLGQLEKRHGEKR